MRRSHSATRRGDSTPWFLKPVGWSADIPARRVGDVVAYKSMTTGLWVPTIVTDVSETDGSIMVGLHPGRWIAAMQQVFCIRPFGDLVWAGGAKAPPRLGTLSRGLSFSNLTRDESIPPTARFTRVRSFSPAQPPPPVLRRRAVSPRPPSILTPRAPTPSPRATQFAFLRPGMVSPCPPPPPCLGPGNGRDRPGSVAPPRDRGARSRSVLAQCDTRRSAWADFEAIEQALQGDSDEETPRRRIDPYLFVEGVL